MLTLQTAHPLGIGTWLMGGGLYDGPQTFADYTHDKDCVDAINYSLDRGQNHIDTAQYYGAGHTEEIVGQAIKNRIRGNIFLASKIWRSHALKNSVVPAVKDMLRRLQTDYLDLVYAHYPFTEVPMEEYISGLNEAVDAGLVRTIGVSNFNLKDLELAMSLSRHPIVANQIHYNILHKENATPKLRTFCAVEKITIVAYKPVARRLLADQTTNQGILEMAKRYQKTPAQIALQWLIGQPNTLAIPKAVSRLHIDENLGALDFVLEDADRKALDSITTESV